MGKLKNHTTELKLEEMQLIRRLRRHLPFQGKIKTGLRPTSREGEHGEFASCFFLGSTVYNQYIHI